MSTQLEVLRRFYELYIYDPNRFYSVSELEIDKQRRVIERCVSALFSSDFLILDAKQCVKNLLTGGQVVRRYKINPQIVGDIERILNI